MRVTFKSYYENFSCHEINKTTTRVLEGPLDLVIKPSITILAMLVKS